MSAEQQTNQRIAEEELELALSGASDGTRVATELFEVADLLAEQKSLLRSVTETGRASQDRVNLINQLIGKVCDGATVKICDLLISQHWSRPKALVETIDSLAVVALLITARRCGKLDQVEAELFAVLQLFAEHRDLRVQLSELGAGTRNSRATLAESLLGDKVLAATRQLVSRGVKLSDHGRLLQSIRWYSAEAARINGAKLVTVTTARTFTDTQRLRLKTLVETKLGRRITLSVAVDETLMGGYRLNFGEESVDASIRSNITEAKRALVR